MTELVKVHYYHEGTGPRTSAAYTYYTEEPLRIGDVVRVPVRDTTGLAIVCETGVDEATVARFRDKVKVIPAGSKTELPPREVAPAEDIPGVDEHTVDNGEMAASWENPVEDVVEKIETATCVTPTERQVAVINVRPQDNPQVVALADEALKLLEIAGDRDVTDEVTVRAATDDLVIIAKVKKKLTEAKADYTRPIKAHLANVNAAFDRITGPLEAADKTNRDKVLAYRSAVSERARQAAEINRQAAELARKQAEFNGTGEITVDTTPVTVPATVGKVYTALGSTSTQKVVKWELVDKALVPEDYKVLDAAKITKLVKGGGTIPGIRVYTEDTLRVNTK